MFGLPTHWLLKYQLTYDTEPLTCRAQDSLQIPVSTMHADVLAPYVTKSSATMILAMKVSGVPYNFKCWGIM